MSAQSKTFDFVKLVDLDPKPRDKGVIEISGPYYTSVSYGFLKDPSWHNPKNGPTIMLIQEI